MHFGEKCPELGHHTVVLKRPAYTKDLLPTFSSRLRLVNSHCSNSNDNEKKSTPRRPFCVDMHAAVQNEEARRKAFGGPTSDGRKSSDKLYLVGVCIYVLGLLYTVWVISFATPVETTASTTATKWSRLDHTITRSFQAPFDENRLASTGQSRPDKIFPCIANSRFLVKSTW